jgi:hypothetical protein
MIYGMKCTQYYKIHNTEHKRHSFKTLNKYNAYINYMHFTAGNIPSGVLKSVITTREVRAEHIIFMQSYESRFAGYNSEAIY